MFANCNLPNEKPQPQEKVLSAKEYLLDNLKEFPNHDEYDPKLIDAIADFMNGFANYRLNTLQDNGLRKAAEEYLNVVNNAMSFDNMVEYHKAAKAARAKLEKQLK
jgi:hypothetical protein